MKVTIRMSKTVSYKAVLDGENIVSLRNIKTGELISPTRYPFRWEEYYLCIFIDHSRTKRVLVNR